MRPRLLLANICHELNSLSPILRSASLGKQRRVLPVLKIKENEERGGSGDGNYQKWETDAREVSAGLSI